MQLSEEIGKFKIIPQKGLCDDLALTVSEFLFRRSVYGWSRNDEMNMRDLAHMELKITCNACKNIFLLWCELVFSCYSYEIIKLSIEAECELMLRCCSGIEEVFRIKFLNRILSLGLISDVDGACEAIEQILAYSEGIISYQTQKQLKYYIQELN